MTSFVLEGPGGIPGLKQVPSGGSVVTSTNWHFLGNVVVDGTFSAATEVAQAISSASANAFAVGPNGITNPTFNVDASTASAATGLNVKSAAAGAGLALSVVSSGTNENLAISAKGSGTITIAQSSTGIVQVNQQILDTQSASGATATGITLKNTGGAANSNVALSFQPGNLSTGRAQIIGSAPGGSNAELNFLTSTSNGAPASVMYLDHNGTLSVGTNGVTTPAFVADSSTASSVTGLTVKAAAAAGGLAVTTTSSGSNENLTIAALGTGSITFNPAVVATAGGAANDGIKFGSLGVGLFTGTGAPSFSAMNGSIYVDSNATTTTTRIYVNKSGAGTAGTTWTNLTTAA